MPGWICVWLGCALGASAENPPPECAVGARCACGGGGPMVQSSPGECAASSLEHQHGARRRIERRGAGRRPHGMLVLVGANQERVQSPGATAPSPANTCASRHTAPRAFIPGRAAERARLLDRFSQRLRVVEGEHDQLVSCDGYGAVQVPGAHASQSQRTVRPLAHLWRAARSCTGARRRRAAIRRGRARSRAAPAEVGRRESGRGEGCSAARRVTWPSRSRISRGWRLTVCGNMTVSRSGFSARSAPRIAAAWVPVAPEV